MKLTIVNRHYPPNPGITGESAWDLAKYLIEQYNIQVQIVHIDRTYEGGGAIRQPVGQTFPVKTIYKGKNGLLRLLAGFLDGYMLIRKALQVCQGPIIIMTSPPLLPFWASRMLHRRHIPYWLWSMDLFPEGFAAEGKISAKNPIYRWIIRQTYQHAPELLLSLGPSQARHLQHLYRSPSLPTIVLPCGVLMHQERDPQRPGWRIDDGRIYLGYAGNVGQPHSAAFLKSIIRHLNPARHQLVLALYGQKAEEIIQFATGRPGITLLGHIPRSQLHYLDLQLVTLLPEWTHIAVPSKAVSAICSGSPILFCGSPESDSYVLLRDATFLIEDDKTVDQQIAGFLTGLRIEHINARQKAAQQLAGQLQMMVKAAYDQIANKIN